MPDVRDLYSADDLSRQARLRVARRFDGDGERIRDAMEEYEGTFSSVPDYVRAEFEEHVAPCMLWLLDFARRRRMDPQGSQLGDRRRPQEGQPRRRARVPLRQPQGRARRARGRRT